MRHVIDKRKSRRLDCIDPWWDYKSPAEQRSWWMRELTRERLRRQRRVAEREGR